MSEIDVFRAEPYDAQSLSKVATASSGFDMVISPEDIVTVGITRELGEISSFYMLTGEAPVGELRMMHVDPNYTGRGLGRVLIEAAKLDAGMQGMNAFTVDSPWHTAGFFLKLGAVLEATMHEGSIVKLRIDVPKDQSGARDEVDDVEYDSAILS